MTNRLTRWVILAGVAACGCGEDASPGTPPGGNGGTGNDPANRTLKVASSWFSASEQEALQVVLDAFQEQTGATVEVLPLETGQDERTAQYQSSDWDVGQENFFNLADSFDDGEGGYTALDLSSVAGLDAELEHIFPKVREALTVQGTLLGIPMNLHRENTLHYSMALMQAPPSSMQELRALCDDYVAAGHSGPKPLAIAQGDWLYRILFVAMLPPAVVGGTSDDPRDAFAAAADVIAHYIDNDCLWIAPSEHGWQEAAQALIDGEAMMYIHGDWAKGYMVQLGWTPGVDFGIAPAPGSEQAFYYGIDTFALNESSPNLDLAIEFARIALSPEVQAGFSARKGSTPGMLFDDPSATFNDGSLLAAYEQLSLAMQENTAMPVPSWLGNTGGTLLVPLRDGEKTADEVATDFMTAYEPAP